MSQVLLVRHGQASWGAEDYDVLSGRGVEQSAVLGAALAARGLEPTVLVAGAMRRHHGTTGITGAGGLAGPVTSLAASTADISLDLQPAGVERLAAFLAVQPLDNLVRSILQREV